MRVRLEGLTFKGEKLTLTFHQQKVVLANMDQILMAHYVDQELGVADMMTVASRALAAYWDMSDEVRNHCAETDPEFNYIAAAMVVACMARHNIPPQDVFLDMMFHFNEGLTPAEVVRLHELDDLLGHPVTRHDLSDD